MKSTKKQLTTKPEIVKNNMLAEVNHYAIGTWLEPYIGYEFEVTRKTKNHVWFLMDNGGKTKDVEKYDSHVFNIV